MPKLLVTYGTVPVIFGRASLFNGEAYPSPSRVPILSSWGRDAGEHVTFPSTCKLSSDIEQFNRGSCLGDPLQWIVFWGFTKVCRHVSHQLHTTLYMTFSVTNSNHLA